VHNRIEFLSEKVEIVGYSWQVLIQWFRRG